MICKFEDPKFICHTREGATDLGALMKGRLPVMSQASVCVWKRPDPSPLTSRLRCHYTESIKNGWGHLYTAHHSPVVKWVGHRGRVSQHIQMMHVLSPDSRVQCLGFISSHILLCWILNSQSWALVHHLDWGNTVQVMFYKKSFCFKTFIQCVTDRLFVIICEIYQQIQSEDCFKLNLRNYVSKKTKKNGVETPKLLWKHN